MKRRAPTGSHTLLINARAIAEELRMRRRGTGMVVRTPSIASKTRTGGCVAAIGRLGRSGPKLEIWYDRYSGYADRKLWAGLSADSDRRFAVLLRRVGRRLTPVRRLTDKDVVYERPERLAARLPRSVSGKLILESYSGSAYLGIYELSSPRAGASSRRFILQAAALIESIARTMPRAAAEEESQEAYPKYENRKRVTMHLRRERSRLLATQCKIRDDYQCQVCDLRFHERYGPLGRDFAEAHHREPLSSLDGVQRTRVEDLVTVCANCHRMLHRMEGRAGDVRTLKAIVGRRR